MFNLEESITEWRQRMLAAGIQTPMPLEELESHLRDEIERQVKAGGSQAEAFHYAVPNIGQPNLLRPEFIRAAGVLGWLGSDRATQINRILGLGWIGGSLWDLQYYTWLLADFLYFPFFNGIQHLVPNISLMYLEMSMDLVGVLAGFYLFGGARASRWIIWALAWLQLLDTLHGFTGFSAAVWLRASWNWYLLTSSEIGFLLASLWLLSPFRKNALPAS